MNKPSLLLPCLLSLGLIACGGDGGSAAVATADPEPQTNVFSYQAVTDADVQLTINNRQDRVVDPQNISVVYQKHLVLANGEFLTIKVYEYQVDNRLSYGTVILPHNWENRDLPIAMELFGLDQSDPEVWVDTLISHSPTLNALFDNFIVVIPAYRGNHFQFEQQFASQGDFCDAYDGAADDSVALLNLVEQHIPQADTSKVLAQGWSRGGNVAHLMGQRDSRVKMVIAGAGPTDFYRQSVADRYQGQYVCQFIDGRTAEQSKLKMLASSPLHFAAYSPITRIHHGTEDEIVPLWHASQMHDALQQNGKDSVLYEYSGGDHGYSSYVDEFTTNFEFNVDEFLSL